MRRWRRPRPRPVDRALARITIAADYGRLWVGLAVALAVLGGERGTRAAKVALLSLGFTSATVNGPLKLLAGRRRPKPHRPMRRSLPASSFPSGHTASAFAFATAATRELPAAGPILVPLAAMVAYSRVYVGARYPSDVVAGAILGAAAGMGARPAARKLGISSETAPLTSFSVPLPSEAVLVASPHAGNSDALVRARGEIDRQRVVVTEELDIEHVERLPALLRTADDRPRLVIAAGGDGTVGAVAGYLAGTENVLAILPLGTSNDFARSLGIPMNPRRAARLLETGGVARVDLGRVRCPGEPPRHFVHAATVGLNVNFARLATRASVRARLGRLTYLAAAIFALRERPSFRCALRTGDHVEQLTLLELSVINAPIFGGPLGLNVASSQLDDGQLVAIAVEVIPPWKVLRAALSVLFRVGRVVPGVRAMKVARMGVESGAPLGLALDGEVIGALPGLFDVAAGALCVITPCGLPPETLA